MSSDIKPSELEPEWFLSTFRSDKRPAFKYEWGEPETDEFSTVGCDCCATSISLTKPEYLELLKKIVECVEKEIERLGP